MNVVEPILFQARNDPPAPAMCAPGTSLGIINYARLARFILSIGHRAIRLGIAPNAVVAIRVKDNIFHAAIALGLMHIGAATISVGAAFPPDLTSTSFSLIPLKLSPMDETQRSSYSRFFSSYRVGSGGDFGHMLYVLSRGGTIFFPGASTIETLQTLELYKVQGLIASPGWLSVFLKHYDDSTDFRSGFEVILSTGSALSASLSQRVRARLCSNLIFYYGTTETSTISSALAYALYEGAAGYIAPGVTVRVIDSEGKILGPDNEGLLLVRTLVSVDRYLNEFAEAKTPFRDGYFDTGDIGCVTSEKMLVITGHKKGVLNLGGNKVSPRLIEEARCDHHSVREALAFAVPGELGIDEVWALVVPASSLDEDALQRFCWEKLPHAQVPLRFITVANLPRTEIGKLDRHRLNAIVRRLRGSTG